MEADSTATPRRKAGKPTVCACHGELRDADRGCKEKRRARQRAYMQRRLDADPVFRIEHTLESRRRKALRRRAIRDAA